MNTMNVVKLFDITALFDVFLETNVEIFCYLGAPLVLVKGWDIYQLASEAGPVATSRSIDQGC